MNNRERANFIALKDFEHDVPAGIFTFKTSYKKGDRLSLRVHGKMAKHLLNKGDIERLEDGKGGV